MKLTINGTGITANRKQKFNFAVVGLDESTKSYWLIALSTKKENAIITANNETKRKNENIEYYEKNNLKEYLEDAKKYTFHIKEVSC